MTYEALEKDIRERITILQESRPVIETLKYSDRHKRLFDNVLMDKLKLDEEVDEDEEEAAKKTVSPPKISYGRSQEQARGERQSLPMSLQHNEWMPSYTDNSNRKIESDGAWHLKCSIMDPYGNEYNQGYQTKATDSGLSKFYKLSDIMSPDWAAKTKYNTNLSFLLPKQIYSPSIVDWELLNTMGWSEEIEEMLEIKLIEMGGDQEIFSSEAWRHAFDINEPIFIELCHEFYSTYDFNESVRDDELWFSKIIKFRLEGIDHLLTLLQFAKRLGLYFNEEVGEEGFETYFLGGLRSDEHFNAREYWLTICREEGLHLSRSHASTIRKLILIVLQKMILALDKITLRELIGPNGKLITEAPMLGAPTVAMPIPPHPSMQDLYDRMGNMEIRHGVVERMAYRQSYQWDRYAGVFEHIAGVYNVPL
nr:hypothetical protein [Tanacetum cinerariifolium]